LLLPRSIKKPQQCGFFIPIESLFGQNIARIIGIKVTGTPSMNGQLHRTVQPFVRALGIALIALFSTSALSGTEDCEPIKIDKWVKMDYAISGNKIVGQGLTYRLIGVYAPLREKKNKFFQKGQPLAKESQDMLNKILANHDLEVGIEYDKVEVDDFFRVNIHAYVKEGDRIVSVQRLLLETGLGIAFPEPQNDHHAKCYFQAEQKARERQIGLWGVAAKYPQLHFPIVKSSELTQEDQGFRLIQGPVKLVERSSNNIIINLDTTGIRVRKPDWKRFDYGKIKKLKGQTIEVRGYGFLYNKAMFVIIQTPLAIDNLNPYLTIPDLKK
jgi:endonuclease YncB( thermonuclease family)